MSENSTKGWWQVNSMLDKSRVRIHVRADGWEDAVRKAGEVLLDRGSIEKEYIDNMIQSVKTMGPYMVLMPGFALAHAAPCEAVRQSDISLITLETPVDFGSVNDPVSVVLCLACTDHSSHVDHLSRIAGVLMEENKVEQIIASDSEDQIVRLFQQAQP